MEMREIFLFEEGGQCYWRKKGIVVPKTFWPELAKTQLNNPDKIMMISLAARIVSVQAVALSECDKKNSATKPECLKGGWLYQF